MNPKTKNIIILVGVAVVLILIYIFFIKKGPAPDTSLTSSTGTSIPSNDSTLNETLNIDTNFVSVLLNVKNLKLDSSIFTDPAFLALRDGSITLVQDGTQGRPNPFAPIGSETVAPPAPPVVPTVLPPLVPPVIPPVKP